MVEARIHSACQSDHTLPRCVVLGVLLGALVIPPLAGALFL